MKNISGFWVGHYAYDNGERSPVSFDAELTHEGLQLSGVITEPNTIRALGYENKSELISAELVGIVSGASLNFVKTYVGGDVPTDPIAYDGRLDNTRNTITGTWRVLDASGRFEMKRDGPPVGVRLKSAKAKAGLEMEVQPKKP